MLTDTVGFINKLPLTVIAAFRATLEELSEAEVLLHIVDITHTDAAQQCLTVENTLDELDLGNKLRLTVLNKLDLAIKSEKELKAVKQQFIEKQLKPAKETTVVLISAVKGWGLEELLQHIALMLKTEKHLDKGVTI